MAAADSRIAKVMTYLRQIEKLAAAGDLEAIAREARLAMSVCEQKR
tara:strand:+ start:1280 stop:1417 length:138 start_codon:yes stop_codon:yes gene_type:complete